MRLPAALAAAALVLGSAAWAATPSPETVGVTMPGKAYAPGEVDVLLGAKVSWRNTDSATHTVTEDEDAFDSSHLRPGQSFERAFSQVGTFAYHCTIHRFMRGVVRVYAVVLRGPERPLLAGFATKLEGRAPPGATEVVLERVAPGRGEVRRAVPAPEGEFAFALRASAPSAYRVRAGEASSPVVHVPVAPHVSLQRAGRLLEVAAIPARPRSPVAVQAYDRELFGWVTVLRGRLDASLRARIPFQPSERAHVRAIVVGRGGWSNGVSPVRVLGQR